MSPFVALFHSLFLSHLRFFYLNNRSMLPCLFSPVVPANQALESGVIYMGYSLYTKLWALQFCVSPWLFQARQCLVSPRRSISIQLLQSSYRIASRGLAWQRPIGLWSTGSLTGLLSPLMNSLKSKELANQLLQATEIALFSSDDFRHPEAPR
jgi:hypothetical protein